MINDTIVTRNYRLLLHVIKNLYKRSWLLKNVKKRLSGPCPTLFNVTNQSGILINQEYYCSVALATGLASVSPWIMRYFNAATFIPDDIG